MSWIERKKKVQQQFANILDIPGELMMNMPKVIIVGDIQVIIENHRGIMAYGCKTVQVNTTLGPLTIEGMGLTLKNILTDEIVIEGKVTSVYFGNQGEA